MYNKSELFYGGLGMIFDLKRDDDVSTYNADNIKHEPI